MATRSDPASLTLSLTPTLQGFIDQLVRFERELYPDMFNPSITYKQALTPTQPQPLAPSDRPPPSPLRIQGEVDNFGMWSMGRATDIQDSRWNDIGVSYHESQLCCQHRSSSPIMISDQHQARLSSKDENQVFSTDVPLQKSEDNTAPGRSQPTMPFGWIRVLVWNNFLQKTLNQSRRLCW